MNSRKSKILIVGDLHGDWGALNRLIQKKEPEIVIQCGDFGWWPKMEIRRAIIYTGHSRWMLEGIKPGSSIVYWCDGNHEDHEDLISKGRQQKHEILCYPGVIYKPRGTVMKLSDGRFVLFAGGGESIDRRMRTPGFDWFPEEIPTGYEHAQLLNHDHIDIVISHTCPSEWVPDVCRGEKLGDPTREILQDVLEKYKPSLWYHGHWHNEAEGVARDSTKWYSLDYPGHKGRWWRWLD